MIMPCSAIEPTFAVGLFISIRFYFRSSRNLVMVKRGISTTSFPLSRLASLVGRYGAFSSLAIAAFVRA
jgi:hypothetical protein